MPIYKYLKVAVKLALAHATEKDLRDFQKEIEIMKILGYHLNVIW